MTVYSSFPQYMAVDRAFNSLTRALEFRTTSKREDEAICVASILGLEVKGIVETKTAEQRMCILYSQIKTMPASILFHLSKRLQDGFRWAPRTLLGPKYGYTFSSMSGVGKCDIEGLHVQFAGFIVTGQPVKLSNDADDTSASFFIGDAYESAPRMMVRSGHNTYSIVENMHVTTARSALLEALDFIEQMQKTAMPAIIVNPADTTESALVAVRKEEEGVIYGTFLRKVYVRPPRMASGLYNDWRNRLLQTREVPSDQRWCIN